MGSARLAIRFFKVSAKALTSGQRAFCDQIFISFGNSVDYRSARVVQLYFDYFGSGAYYRYKPARSVQLHSISKATLATGQHATHCYFYIYEAILTTEKRACD